MIEILKEHNYRELKETYDCVIVFLCPYNVNTLYDANFRFNIIKFALKLFFDLKFNHKIN